jgi:hypothetical protein
MGAGTSGGLVGTEGLGDIVGPLGIFGSDKPTGVLMVVDFAGWKGREVLVVNVAGEESGGGADSIVGSGLGGEVGESGGRTVPIRLRNS